jgi:CcmD family protein
MIARAWHGPAASLGASLAVLAQEAAPSAAPATTFTAETVASRPEVAARGFRFLIGAYSVVWIILAVYLLTLSTRLRRLSRQVRRLKEKSVT